MIQSQKRRFPKKKTSRRGGCAGWNCGARREITGSGPDAASLLSKHPPLASRRADVFVDRDDLFESKPEGGCRSHCGTRRENRLTACWRPRARELGDRIYSVAFCVSLISWTLPSATSGTSRSQLYPLASNQNRTGSGGAESHSKNPSASVRVCHLNLSNPWLSASVLTTASGMGLPTSSNTRPRKIFPWATAKLTTFVGSSNWTVRVWGANPSA